MDPSTFVHGWIDSPERHDVAASAGLVPLAQAAPHLMMSLSPGQDIKPYLALKEVLGAYPHYPAQKIGDCESFGHGHGNDLLQAIEIAAGDKGLVWEETSTEALYGAGRQEAGMLGSWQDGCYGAAMVKAMTEIGAVPRSAVGDGKYSGDRAKQWGHDGIPDDIRKLAAQSRLGSAAKVTTWDEMVSTFNNQGVVSVSSDQGFEPWGRGFVRDAAGICEAGGTWGHCMLIVGVIASDGVETAVIFQSWGDEMPGGPCPFDMPPFAFRARRPVVERMLAAGDSFGLFKAPGFERKPVPSSWSNGGLAA